MKKCPSQFLFTGASVLTVVFLLSQSWLLLPLPFFIAFLAMMRADQEQILQMDASVGAMLLNVQQRPLLSLDAFRGSELLFYRAGYPVYRRLRGLDGEWELVGEQHETPMTAARIRVFPGFIYQQQSGQKSAQDAPTVSQTTPAPTPLPD